MVSTARIGINNDFSCGKEREGKREREGGRERERERGGAGGEGGYLLMSSLF